MCVHGSQTRCCYVMFFQVRKLTVDFPVFTSKTPGSTTRFCQNPPAKTGSHHPPKNYRRSAPLQAGFGPFRRMTTAAATLSWLSRSRALTPQPARLSDRGEWSKDVPKPKGMKFSPENIASPKDLILWRFSRVLRVAIADNNHAWTYWRWRQS